MPRRWLFLCVALATACGEADDDSCDPGASTKCPQEQNGPRHYRYCRADGTWSECTPVVLCDPLAQIGCPEGLVCYRASGMICAPADSLPCSPGETWGSGIDGIGCQPHCESEGAGTLNEDPEHCAPGEVCDNAGVPAYEHVGTCYFSDSDGE